MIIGLMKKYRFMTLVMLVGVILLGVGCRTNQKRKRTKATNKYPHALRTIFNSPPQIVISQTDLVLANQRVFYMGQQSKVLTNLDGFFEFRMALGSEYRIKVKGINHTQTNFLIEYQRPQDEEIAEIIRSSVESKLTTD